MDLMCIIDGLDRVKAWVSGRESTIEILLLLATLLVTFWISIQALSISTQQTAISGIQNQINTRSVELSNFSEIFITTDAVDVYINGNKVGILWRIQVRNAGFGPTYIDYYVLNGAKQQLNRSVIPASMDTWYGIMIPDDVQVEGKFYLEIQFEDHLGQKYISHANGVFEHGWWKIDTNKREVISN